MELRSAPYATEIYVLHLRGITFNGGRYDGIGLLNDDLVGLDCDDCVNDDGTLSDLAIEVINTVGLIIKNYGWGAKKL